MCIYVEYSSKWVSSRDVPISKHGDHIIGIKNKCESPGRELSFSKKYVILVSNTFVNS